MLKIIVFLCTASGLLFADHVKAGIVLPTVPSGSFYQLIFVTSDTIDGTNPYDFYYSNLAAADAAAIPGIPAGVSWNAVTSADIFTSANYNAPSYQGIPIYNLQGVEVASGAMGLYSGTLLAPVKYDETGTVTTAPYVWTGSTPDGNPYYVGDLGRATDLAMSIPQAVGDPLATGGAWLFSTTQYDSNLFPVYALSTPIRNAPEPSTLLLAALGGVALLASHLRRRI